MRVVTPDASNRMWWSDACMQCHNVDSLCQSTKIFLFLRYSNCYLNSFQLHLFCFSWQADVWGDTCPVVVDRDIYYSPWTSTSPHWATSARRTKAPKGKDEIET